MAGKNVQLEKNKLNRKIRDLQNQINGLMSERKNIDQQVKRLQRAYRELGQMKLVTRFTKMKANSIMDKKYQWKGNKYNIFTYDGDLLEDEYNSYINSIDFVMDSINVRICELKNSFDSKFGLIGSLQCECRKLNTKIKNLVN